MKTYEVSKAAYTRGFGTPEEIIMLGGQTPTARVFGGTPYIKRKATAKERRSR
jgi:hypothetical protein